MCPGFLQSIRAMADLRRGSAQGAKGSTKTSVCIERTPYCAMYYKGLRRACANLGASFGRETYSAVSSRTDLCAMYCEGLRIACAKVLGLLGARDVLCSGLKN